MAVCEAIFLKVGGGYFGTVEGIWLFIDGFEGGGGEFGLELVWLKVVEGEDMLDIVDLLLDVFGVLGDGEKLRLGWTWRGTAGVPGAFSSGRAVSWNSCSEQNRN